MTYNPPSPKTVLRYFLGCLCSITLNNNALGRVGIIGPPLRECCLMRLLLYHAVVTKCLIDKKYMFNKDPNQTLVLEELMLKGTLCNIL